MVFGASVILVVTTDVDPGSVVVSTLKRHIISVFGTMALLCIHTYLVTVLGASVLVIVVVNSLVMLVVITEVEAGSVRVSTTVIARE